MNSPQRREYLEALGLKSWTLRERFGGAPAVAAASAATATAVAATTAAIATTAATAEVAATVAPRVLASPSSAEAREVSPMREDGADWSGLQARVAACTRCSLSGTRTQTVFGVGNRDADWLVVGEAPGADEDRKGEPFVGRAGQLLNSMLLAIGLPREQVYIANVLKCRPPGNRDPSPTEAAECLPFLERQIALLKPKIMLVVGRIAAQNLLRTDKTLGSLRQQVHKFGVAQVPLVVTYHPAYLLRTPSDKRKAWEDLKFAREVCARV